MDTAAKLRSYHPRGDLGAASRVDRTSVVKVDYKMEKSPWALFLTEPVSE